MKAAEINLELVVWVEVGDDATVEHYVDALSNAILVNYQLQSFGKAGLHFNQEEE